MLRFAHCVLALHVMGVVRSIRCMMKCEGGEKLTKSIEDLKKALQDGEITEVKLSRNQVMLLATGEYDVVEGVIEDILKQAKRAQEKKSVGELLKDYNFNEFASEILTKILDNEEVVNGVIRSIPEDWEYSEMQYGSNPTKYNIAFAWLWEQLEGAKGIVITDKD